MDALTPNESDLRQGLLGTDLLTWACNVSGDDLAARLPAGKPLREEAEAALQEMLRRVEPIARGHERQEDIVNFTNDLLGYDDASGMTVPCALRRMAGGSLPELPSDEPVAALLAELARDLFPVALLPIWGGLQLRHRALWGLGRPLQTHPKTHAFVDAVLADGQLSTLYPSEGPEPGQRSGRWTSSSGWSRIRAAHDLPLDLLTAGLAAWTLGEARSADAFLSAVLNALSQLCQLASGRPVPVRGRVGLVGAVSLSNELRLHGQGDGRVLAAANTDVPLPTQDGDQPTLELTVPWHMVVTTVGERPSAPSDAHVRLTGAVTQVRRAAMLGLDPPLVLREGFRMVPDPVTNFGEPQVMLRGDEHDVPLGEAETEAVQRVIDRLAESDTRRAEIALERTLRALADRNDPVDAFIDAVVAWESLFGSDQGELTFRIAAAMAWLLAESPEERKELHDQIKALYRLRSRVVHGGNLSTQQAEEKRQEAFELALRALKKLLWERRDLLPDDNRSTKLILGLLAEA